MLLTSIAMLATLVAPTDSIIKRGEALPNATPVPLAAVLANADRYVETPVLVEGVIVKSCENKGCWMQLAPTKDADGVRVTFKDYGFFIPLDAAGMKARAYGIVTRTTHSKSDADHLIAEGAKLVRNPDGTATELGFEARGVELRPAT